MYVWQNWEEGWIIGSERFFTPILRWVNYSCLVVNVSFSLYIALLLMQVEYLIETFE